MAQKDTQLLGEILSVQKAILAKMNEQDKKDKDKEKKSAKVEEAKVEAQGFGAMIKELQTLNKTANKQLEELKGIREAIGGMGSSGGGSLNSLGSADSTGEKLSSLGSGMVTLAIGILALVGGMAALALVSVIAPMAAIGAVSVGLIVYGFYKLFKKVGDPETKEQVDDGLENLFRMAGGIAVFTLAIVASTLAMESVGGGAIVKNLVLALIGFGGIFYILGKGGETIKEGAYAAAAMGFGLAVLGLGVLAMVWSLKQAGELLSGGGGAAVAIGGLAALAIVAVAGVTFFILGEVAREVAMGALAVAAIGLGLAAFGLGLTVYLSGIAKIMGVGGGGVMGGTEIKGGFFDTLGSMLVGLGIIATGAMTLILYGSIFALAGLFELGVPLMIMAGAGAFATVGLGLVFFGLGLDFYLGVIQKNIGVSSTKSEGMKISGESFTAGLVTMGGAVGMLFTIGGIMALAGAVSPLILLGAGAIATSGLALASLGYGIKTYMEQAGGEEVGDELKTNLAKIRDAFLTFVGEEKLGEAGVFDSLKGLIRGGATAGTLAAGISAATLIGPALSSIAQGLGTWANITQAPKIIGYDEMGQPIFDKKEVVDLTKAMSNITDSFPKILQPFIDLSNTANLKQEESILSILTGVNFSESPFSRGVQIAGQIGPVLSSLAQGIGAFGSLTQAPKITGYNEMGQPIYDKGTTVNILDSISNISTAVEEVLKPFVWLSKEANLEQGQNLLSVLTGIQLTESPFSRGVQVAGQIGAVLSSMAQGIGAFANLAQAPKFTGYDDKGQPIYDDSATVDILASIDNVKVTIEEVLKPFVDLANNAALKQEENLLSILTGIHLNESPFARGVGIVGQMGAVLSNLAGGIGVFANLSQMPKITGYDEMGQPIFSTSETFDVISGIQSLVDVLDPYGDSSIVAPFVTLAETVAMTKPKSLLGWVSEALTGVNPAASPLETGITLGMQMGEIISNIASGMGQMGNLAAVAVITGYDNNGRPTYGKPVNALESVKNFGKIMGDLIIAFADAARRAGPYADPEELEAIGPTVGGILGAVTDSLDTFSNPNKLKKIKGYDDKGRPIYYENEFVNVDDVINTMQNVVLKIIKAFGTEEVADAMDNLDIDEDEMIGDYLAMFMKPISGFAKIVGELNGLGINLYGLTDQIVYSSLTFIKKFGDLDYDAIDKLETTGEYLYDFSDNILGAFEDLLEFDQTDKGFFTSETNPKGSALMGIADNISYSVKTLSAAFAPDSTMPQLADAEKGSLIVHDILENMKKFPAYMKNFTNAKPNEFGDGAKAAFDGLFVITKVAEKGEGKGYTHMKLFTDQMNRLANIATPFEKFANSFGKMAKDMGVFAENFSLMDENGIMAFKEWTDSIVTLSTANPSTFAANVVTANKAIDAGFNVGEDEGLVDEIVNTVTGDNKTKGEKQDIINKNTTPGSGTGGDGKPVKMPSAAEIGSAVAKALQGAEMNVYITGKAKGV
jgi:hypothetical protein